VAVMRLQDEIEGLREKMGKSIYTVRKTKELE